MPFDGAKLSQTAQQLVNYQKWLELNGERSWHKGAWRREHAGVAAPTFCLMAGLMEANGGYKDNERYRLSGNGDLARACRTMMLCLPEPFWDTQQEYAILVNYNDQNPTSFETIKQLVHTAVEAEVKKCLVQNVTVGS